MNSSKPSDGTTEQSLPGTSSETASEFQEHPRKPSEKPSFLNSPEWLEACKAFQEATQEYNLKMEKWWAELDPETQQWAFYNVCRLIYKGDVVDRHSYRGVLYDTFGWGPEAYAIGMEARYMELHNLLYDAVEGDTKYTQRDLNKINQELNDAAEYDASQA